MHGPACVFWANLTAFSLVAQEQESIAARLRTARGELEAAERRVEEQVQLYTRRFYVCCV
jgi:hypothetical protein